MSGPRPGQGQAVKLLNNFLSATALAATSEAIAFGTGQGIDMKIILDIVNASTGRNSATDDKFPRRIMHGRYDAGFTAKLQLKDIRLYLENARAAGITDEVGRRGGRRLGADGGGDAGRRHHRNVSIHAEGPPAASAELIGDHRAPQRQAVSSVSRCASTGWAGGGCDREPETVDAADAGCKLEPAGTAVGHGGRGGRCARARSSGCARTSWLFGLAIVVPVLLYSAFVLHRYTQSERASNERRALGIARASAPTSTARSPPSSPRWRRWQPPRALAARGLRILPRPGAKLALRSRLLERRSDRPEPPAARQHAPALGDAAADERSDGARPAGHRPEDRASPMSRTCSSAPWPSGRSSRSACRCGWATRFRTRSSCRSSPSGWSRS